MYKFFFSVPWRAGGGKAIEQHEHQLERQQFNERLFKIKACTELILHTAGTKLCN